MHVKTQFMDIPPSLIKAIYYVWDGMVLSNFCWIPIILFWSDAF